MCGVAVSIASPLYTVQATRIFPGIEIKSIVSYPGKDGEYIAATSQQIFSIDRDGECTMLFGERVPIMGSCSDQVTDTVTFTDIVQLYNRNLSLDSGVVDTVVLIVDYSKKKILAFNTEDTMSYVFTDSLLLNGLIGVKYPCRITPHCSAENQLILYMDGLSYAVAIDKADGEATAYPSVKWTGNYKYLPLHNEACTYSRTLRVKTASKLENYTVFQSMLLFTDQDQQRLVSIGSGMTTPIVIMHNGVELRDCAPSAVSPGADGRLLLVCAGRSSLLSLSSTPTAIQGRFRRQLSMVNCLLKNVNTIHATGSSLCALLCLKSSYCDAFTFVSVKRLCVTFLVQCAILNTGVEMEHYIYSKV